MTLLRRRLIEEITLRGYSDKTREAYVHAVACLAPYYGRAPEQFSDEELNTSDTRKGAVNVKANHPASLDGESPVLLAFSAHVLAATEPVRSAAA